MLQCWTNRKPFGFMIDDALTIEPGETKDLGTLQFGMNGKRINSERIDE